LNAAKVSCAALMQIEILTEMMFLGTEMRNMATEKCVFALELKFVIFALYSYQEIIGHESRNSQSYI
jgi:succinate-acetate transporter protein